MKRLLTLSLLISFPLVAMNPATEPVAGSQKKGNAGFLQDTMSFIASPVTACAEQVAIKAIMEPIVACKKEFVAEIVAGVTAANQAQLKELTEQLRQLQATLQKQNSRCCTIQ